MLMQEEEEDMTSRSSDAASDRPPVLSFAEIDKILSMALKSLSY
jgi:hypothetical protein